MTPEDAKKVGGSDASPLCVCGCGKPAEFIIGTTKFAPNAADRRGEWFEDPCCHSYASYLVSAADELGFISTRRRLNGTQP